MEIKCLLVCHAGSKIGLGHLSRSFVMARALRQYLDAKVFLILQGDTVKRHDLDAFQHKIIGIERRLSEAVIRHARESNPHVVIFDLYPQLVPKKIDALLDELHEIGCKVVSIDGLISQRRRLDLLFIPSMRSPLIEDLPNSAPILFGWDCYLLNIQQKPVHWKPGNKVLALTGGSDPTGLGKTLPALLDQQLPERSEVHWVTGPFAAEPVFPMPSRLRMVNHVSPDGLEQLMIQSNYAVTVFGVSLFELLYFGIPTVVFSPYGNKDNKELEMLAKEELAVVGENATDAVRQLCVLMKNDRLSAWLSHRAGQKVSGTGGKKLAQAVAELVVK
jgi:spore coat polysaccharide biosynthesis predicted glycosyltransferase SpsG